MNEYPRGAVSGVVLAGGRALRMGGQDKGLLRLRGRPMVTYAVDALRPQVGGLLINANRNLSDYRELGLPVVSDTEGEYLGPLAGMLAALDADETPYLLTAPCDSPLIYAGYAERMFAALAADGELAVAHNGERLQPVFALLRRDLRDSLRAYLGRGERKIDRWFGVHRMTVVDFSDCPMMFRNINTPDDLEALELLMEGDPQ